MLHQNRGGNAGGILADQGAQALQIIGFAPRTVKGADDYIGIRDVQRIGIVGMGKAAELANAEMQQRVDKVGKLRDRLQDGILKTIGNVFLNGHPTNRLPGNLSLCIEYIEGESVLLFLDMQGIAVSSGSACTSRALKASHVIMATGVDAALAQGTILFSLGVNNSDADVQYVLKKLPSIVNRLREMSPLYNTKDKKS